MNALLIILFLQLAVPPPRTFMENPALTAEIPRDLKKDYDRAWTRFLSGREDARVARDLEKLVKKKKDFAPASIVMAYVDIYAGKPQDAERKLEQVLARNPDHRIALYHLAELAFARTDYVRASELYARLMAADRTRTDLEGRRQKALLLATGKFLNAASLAKEQERLSEAEGFYRQALSIAPDEPSIHAELGTVLSRQKKWDEAITHLKRALELRPSESARSALVEALTSAGRIEEARGAGARSGVAERVGADVAAGTSGDELADLGRWGEDIGHFRAIESTASLTREHLAALLVRYFPELMEFKQEPRILTDTQGLWAASEIQVAAGLGLMEVYPNHTFRPALPVNRGEFAVSLARVARLLDFEVTLASAVRTSDVGAGNLLYNDIQWVVGNQLLRLNDAESFGISAIVSGDEAVRAVRKLLQLSGKKAA